MESAARQRLTPQEYLAIERAALEKSEYYNGEMFALAGTTREHSLINGNIAAALRNQLKDHPFETYSNNMRVRTRPGGLYTYPDVVVVCGDREFEDAEVDILVNPTLIVEVLSTSTEAYDRGDKFAMYRENASLQEYVIVSQHQPRVESYLRQANGTWLLSIASGLEATIRLTSIDCELALSEVYERLTFAVPEALAKGSRPPE